MATPLSDVLQVTLLSVASLGVTVAVSVADSPSVSLKLVSLNEIPATAIVLFSTVTSQLALCSPAVAVILVVPGATAVTTPSLTVATPLSDVFQVMLEPETETGPEAVSAIAVRVKLSFSETVIADSLSEMLTILEVVTISA